jgi:hypothetical protein
MSEAVVREAWRLIVWTNCTSADVWANVAMTRGSGYVRMADHIIIDLLGSPLLKAIVSEFSRSQRSHAPISAMLAISAIPGEETSISDVAVQGGAGEILIPSKRRSDVAGSNRILS